MSIHEFMISFSSSYIIFVIFIVRYHVTDSFRFHYFHLFYFGCLLIFFYHNHLHDVWLAYTRHNPINIKLQSLSHWIFSLFCSYLSIFKIKIGHCICSHPSLQWFFSSLLTAQFSFVLALFCSLRGKYCQEHTLIVFNFNNCELNMRMIIFNSGDVSWISSK